VIDLPKENPKPVNPRSFSRSTWSKCGECNGSGLCKTSFGIPTEYACLHCNAVGWHTPEGYRLDEANALLMLRVAANQAAKAMRAFGGSKKAGGESNDSGPSAYYVQGKYNGD
jgi:hypothetical protein